MMNKFEYIVNRASFRHCFIAWTLIDGGSTTSLNEYCLSLSGLNNLVTLIARGVGVPYKINENFTVIPVTDYFPKSTILSHIYFIYFVIRYLKKNQFDIINLFKFHGMSLIRIFLFLKKTKWVLHIRSSYVGNNIIGLFKNLVIRIEACFFGDKTILDKGFASNLFFGNRATNKMLELPLGINPKLFNKEKDNRLELFGMKIRNKKLLIYVGNIDRPRKLDVFLDAIKIVLDNFNNCMLIMVGGGNQIDYLKNKARKLGIENDIIFTGKISYFDVPKYISSADIGLSYIPMNKLYNHQPPLKTLEYLQMGIPQVATNISANRKYIIHEHNAIIADDDPESFAKAVLLLLTKLSLHRHIMDHSKNSLNAFYWDKITKEILVPFYNELMLR